MSDPVSYGDYVDPEVARIVGLIGRYEAAKAAIPGITPWGALPAPGHVAEAQGDLDHARRALEHALRRRRSFAHGGKSYFLDSQGDLFIVRTIGVQEAMRDCRRRGTPHRAVELGTERPAHVREKRIRET